MTIFRYDSIVKYIQSLRLKFSQFTHRQLISMATDTQIEIQQQHTVNSKTTQTQPVESVDTKSQQSTPTIPIPTINPKAIDALIVISVLIEDLCALYWQSPDVSDRTVFWIFYAFTICTSIIDTVFVCNAQRMDKSTQYMITASTIIVEVVQAIIFMAISEGTQKWSFILFLLFQAAMEAWKLQSLKQSSGPAAKTEDKQQSKPEPDKEAKEEEAEDPEWDRLKGTAYRCGFQLFLGLLVMPLLYYNSGPFRTQGFDIYGTILIWTGVLLSTFPKPPECLGFCTNKAQDWPGTLFVIHGFVAWIMCLIYVFDGETDGYELSMSWIIIASIPTCCCCVFCHRCHDE